MFSHPVVGEKFGHIIAQGIGKDAQAILTLLEIGCSLQSSN
jgi:hypothetical protein